MTMTGNGIPSLVNHVMGKTKLDYPMKVHMQRIVTSRE